MLFPSLDCRVLKFCGQGRAYSLWLRRRCQLPSIKSSWWCLSIRGVYTLLHIQVCPYEMCMCWKVYAQYRLTSTVQAAEEAEAAAELLQKAEAALQEVTRAETAAAETSKTCLSSRISLLFHLILASWQQALVCNKYPPLATNPPHPVAPLSATRCKLV